MQASLYGAAGVPVAALERIWAGDRRGGAQRAGRRAGADPAQRQAMPRWGSSSARQATRARWRNSAPSAASRCRRTGHGAAGADRQDTAAARKALAAPDSGRKMYPNWRPLYAQAQFLLGDYAGTVETLQLFETDQFLTRGFDSRWAMIGRVRLLRAAAYEKLGRRTEAAEQYQLVLAQWKSADPEIWRCSSGRPRRGWRGCRGRAESGAGRSGPAILAVGQARWSRVLRHPRKVRAPEGRLPGNAWAPQGDGQGNRKQTARGRASAEGKGERVG